MLPQVVSQTGVGTSKPVVHDHFRNPFNVGIGCVVTGTVNYTVQHTFDDIVDLGAGSVTWFNHDDPVFVAAIANANSNYSYCVTASQIVVNSGSGTVTGTFIQAGLRGG